MKKEDALTQTGRLEFAQGELMNFKEYFSKQARTPSGLFGRWIMSRIFEKGNADLNRLMIRQVAAEKTDHILEIGFGSGALIYDMAKAATQGRVEGIDSSRPMVSLARKKNRTFLETGRVQLHLGEFEQHSYPDNAFDKICTANTIYFWPDPVTTLKKIHTVLKPGGKLVIGFGDKKQLEEKELSPGVFKLYESGQVVTLLKQGGFTGSIDMVSEQGSSYILNAAVAVK